MDISWKTYGHAAVKNILAKQLAAGQLAHAYLFLGPSGIGKSLLARELAQRILQTADLQHHLDFLPLSGEGEITMETVQDFMAQVRFKPLRASHRVAFMDRAHRLNTQSSNALLKTLEEPSPATILILSADQPLLPTIMSRCQVLHFSKFSVNQLRSFAAEQNLSVSEDLLALSRGSPGRLLGLAQDSAVARVEQDQLQNYRQLKQTSRAGRLLAIAGLAEQEPEDLRELFQNWQAYEALQLRGQPRGYLCLQALAQALQDLQTNKNKKLILQGLLLRI